MLFDVLVCCLLFSVRCSSFVVCFVLPVVRCCLLYCGLCLNLLACLWCVPFVVWCVLCLWFVLIVVGGLLLVVC